VLHSEAADTEMHSYSYRVRQQTQLEGMHLWVNAQNTHAVTRQLRVRTPMRGCVILSARQLTGSNQTSLSSFYD